MKVADLPLAELNRRLGQGLVLAAGPFRVRLQARVSGFAGFLSRLYGGFPLLPADSFADFRLRLRRPRLVRRFFRPQVWFEHDGRRLFEPFPLSHAPPLFEWGWNWNIGTSAHQYLMLHAAVLERGGRTVILPALPGSGKTTLCAALMLRGWRLLSDEFGLVRGDGLIDPLPRPLPLKNRSIEVIREFAPEAVLGPEFPKTRKGTVAHLRPTPVSVARMGEPAEPSWIVFPRFQQGAEAQLRPVVSTYAFLRLAANSFNYEVLGGEGFRLVGALVRRCRCFNFTYGDLEDVLAVFASLSAP